MILHKNLFDKLPQLLKSICENGSTENEKDLLLLSTLAVASGCLLKCSGIYRNETTYPNIFLFLIARAASGKGKMRYTRSLPRKFEESMKLRAQLTPQQISMKKLFIPANSSGASFADLLHENGGKGILFAPEADTLANALEQDWGNFSDSLRQGWQNEDIELSRQKNSTLIEIRDPMFSVILSGTPGQLPGLISSIENGLFSRFLFYIFESPDRWGGVGSVQDGESLRETFEKLSDEFSKVMNYNYDNNFSMKWSKQQEEKIDSVFEDMYEMSKQLNLQPSVIRLANSLFRICIILSAFRRCSTQVTENVCECDAADFEVALGLALPLFEMQVRAAKCIKRGVTKSLIDRFYDALPNSFKREEIIELAAEFTYTSARTLTDILDRLYNQGRLERGKKGHYVKSTPGEKPLTEEPVKVKRTKLVDG
jgi:hypothetical protein